MPFLKVILTVCLKSTQKVSFYNILTKANISPVFLDFQCQFSKLEMNSILTNLGTIIQSNLPIFLYKPCMKTV